MSRILQEFKEFARKKREWVMLPLLILLLIMTMVVIFNRDVIHVPFVYSGF